MADPSCTRRNVLRAGTTLAALGTLSGCLGPLGGDGGDGSDGNDGGDGATGSAPRTDRAPESSDVLVHVDVTRLLNDDLLRQRLSEVGTQATPSYQIDVEAGLDRVQSQTGLDPRKASEVLVFGSYADAGVGAIVWADWDEATVTEQFQAAGQVQTSTHAGQTVYQASNVALAVTADGAFAVGTPSQVRAALDVEAGNASAVSGPLREGYVAAPSGYARFAFTVPESFDPEADDASVAVSAFGEVTSGYGALYRGGGSRGGTVVLEAPSKSAAGDVADAADGLLALAATELAGAQQNQELAAELEAVVDATEVSQDGSTVRIVTDDGRGYLPLIPMAVVSSFFLGLGSEPETIAPTAAFSFDYSSADDTLEIVHSGGDAIPATELVVRGENLGHFGAWPDLDGSASGEVDGAPAVVAGDSVTLSASADYTAEVVWADTENGSSAVLAEDEGPEA